MSNPLERLAQLIRLATNEAAAEGEARNAALEACRLIVRHNVHMSLPSSSVAAEAFRQAAKRRTRKVDDGIAGSGHPSWWPKESADEVFRRTQGDSDPPVGQIHDAPKLGLRFVMTWQADRFLLLSLVIEGHAGAPQRLVLGVDESRILLPALEAERDAVIRDGAIGRIATRHTQYGFEIARDGQPMFPMPDGVRAALISSLAMFLVGRRVA